MQDTKSKVKPSVKAISDKAIVDAVAKWHALKKYVKEYNKLNDILRKEFHGVTHDIKVGKFKVSGKWEDRTVYDIPFDIKLKYAKQDAIWYMNIDEEVKPQ